MMITDRNNYFILTIFSLIINIWVYFGYFPIYSNSIFNKEQFINQFNTGIYQYRFLSREFIMTIYNLIEPYSFYFLLNKNFPHYSIDIHLFLSFFILNTLFLILTSLITYYFIKKSSGIKIKNRLVLVLFIISIIGFSQYVITPYDSIAYFLLIFTAYISYGYIILHKKAFYIYFCLLIILSTLNRETVLLSLSFFSALLIYKYYPDYKYIIMRLILPFFLFIAVYLLIRIIFPTKIHLYDSLELFNNFMLFKNIISLGIAIFLLYIPLYIAFLYNIKLLRLFYFLSIPYFLLVLLVGILYEIRLIIPVFILGIIISQFREKNYV